MMNLDREHRRRNSEPISWLSLSLIHIYISYGSVRATAYCVQPAKPGPGSGNYTITKIGDNQALAKVCYYGTDAAGSESFFANKHTDFSEGKRFIIIHMLSLIHI